VGLLRINEGEPHRLVSRAKKAVVGSTGQRNMKAVMMCWEDPQWHARDDRDCRLS
jgi:hypothetical protein